MQYIFGGSKGNTNPEINSHKNSLLTRVAEMFNFQIACKKFYYY